LRDQLETGDAAPNVSFSAYSAAINTSGGAYSSTGRFTVSTLMFYSPRGLGVTAPSGDSQSPNRTMDNYGYEDLILLVFDDPVTLAELEIGLSQYDSGITAPYQRRRMFKAGDLRRYDDVPPGAQTSRLSALMTSHGRRWPGWTNVVRWCASL